LDWSQSDLEAKSDVARKTIADFEGGRKKRPYSQTLDKLQECFEAAGVEFTNGEAPGVRLRKGS